MESLKKLVSLAVVLIVCFSFAAGANATVAWTAETSASDWFSDGESVITDDGNGVITNTVNTDAVTFWQKANAGPLTVNLDETPILQFELVEKTQGANIVVYTEGATASVNFYPADDLPVGKHALNIKEFDTSGTFTGNQTVYVGVFSIGQGSYVKFKDVRIVSEDEVSAAPATDAPATDAPATDAPATDAPATDAPATDAPATDAPATDAPGEDTPANPATGDNGIAVYAMLAIASAAVLVVARKKLFN